jgi:hypothetical protein
MDKKTYERLRHLEPHFQTAVRAQYKRATTRDEDQLVIDTLKALGKNPHTSLSCGRCSYLNFLMLGNLYFEYLNGIEVAKPKKSRRKED